MKTPITGDKLYRVCDGELIVVTFIDEAWTTDGRGISPHLFRMTELHATELLAWQEYAEILTEIGPKLVHLLALARALRHKCANELAIAQSKIEQLSA